MWFRLARLFGVPVAELQQRMTGREFDEWLAYDTIEPWSRNTTDYMLAQQTQLFIRANSKKGRRVPKVQDLLPRGTYKPPVDWQAKVAQMKAFAAAHNAKLDEKRRRAGAEK